MTHNDRERGKYLHGINVRRKRDGLEGDDRMSGSSSTRIYKYGNSHINPVISSDIYQCHLALLVVPTLSWENFINILSPLLPLSLNPCTHPSICLAKQPFNCPPGLGVTVPADE